nr:hypothetical protein [bacterium]
MPARTDNNQIIAKDNSKQPQYFHNVKVGLLGAFDVKKKTFDQWRMKSKDKILWKEINGTVEINDSFTNTFYEYDTVENFFLDKQLLIGKHGSTNPSKPIRGLLREIFRVSIRLSKRTIKLNFNVSLAYFEKQEVLQLLLYDTIPHIDIDSLIF